MVKAIFAYKILNRFWKPKNEYFWKVSQLSVEQASKFYPTVLYADLNTYSIFKEKGIEFDEFVDCTDLFSTVTEHTYGLTKILTMIKQTSPYIILDLDTVIFSNIVTTGHITYGHKEICTSTQKPILDKETDLKYLEEYYQRSYDKFSSLISYELKHIDWDNYPNNSLMVVNSPKLISEVYKKILQDMGDKIYTVPPTFTMQFYEQFLLYNILRKYTREINFLYDTPPGCNLTEDNTLIDIYSFKYLHLDRYMDLGTQKIIDKLTEKSSDKVGALRYSSYI